MTQQLHDARHERQRNLMPPPNNRLHTDLGGLCRLILIYGIPKLVLIPKSDRIPPPSG
jgi:hypothetical protein